MAHQMNSPAYHLIEHVYQNQGHRQGHSRERFRDGMNQAVRLAIGHGFKFDADDFAKIAKNFRYEATERDYALACGIERGRNNPTATIAYETYKKRKPFLLRSVSYPHSPWQKTANRVAVGMRFGWYYEDKTIKQSSRIPIIVTCTSFAQDGSYFTACSHINDHTDDASTVGDFVNMGCGNYFRINSIEDQGLTVRLDARIYKSEDVYKRRKLDQRFKITHESIKRYHKLLDDEIIHREKQRELEETLSAIDDEIEDILADDVANKMESDRHRGQIASA
jgi:hypothetical protein